MNRFSTPPRAMNRDKAQGLVLPTPPKVARSGARMDKATAVLKDLTNDMHSEVVKEGAGAQRVVAAGAHRGYAYGEVLSMTSPRAAENTAPETPRTPRPTKSQSAPEAPPALVRISKRQEPPLLQAMKNNSIEEVLAALQQEPDAAKQRFWDYDCREPPLCCAVRLQCDIAVLKLLLQYGADPEDADARGKTPYEISKERKKVERHRSVQQLALDMQRSLLPFGGGLQMPNSITQMPNSITPFSQGFYLPKQHTNMMDFPIALDLENSENACWRRDVAILLAQK